ncbi:hypothetical protein CONLIGDRAFT_639107 [Coniochaeta ligniaria NRRL 30616]|uniref:Pt repeat family protein n=1 Tax=Coniochaeta ligniaria NRRL 30616 TaxID=1408157 RepID=A0A1J7JMY6_9PEZI|nr:hypothetical protein CONLIGDRAFT_639107 [Coniochaeta ligniaria NRRL 30616]
MAWCDAGSRSRDSLPSRKEELGLMDGLSRVDQHLPTEVEGLPAGFLTPILPEETAPSSSPLVVHVAINFTDPIIRSKYSLSYASSPHFVPTDKVCNGLLQHIEHCSKEFISRKDSRALDSHHEGTRTLKRQRFEITFRILRRGSQWAERTFRSYQKQPLTVIFTKQVILATHKMIEPFLRSRSEGFPWMDGSGREQDHISDMVTPTSSEPLPPCCIQRSPFMEASETFESTPGYTIGLSFRSRSQRPGQTHFEKVLKINSDQNAPLNLSLAEKLLWDITKSIEGSLSARERQLNKEHEHRDALEGVSPLPHLDDDAVHIDLQITNNVGLSYGHLHREFGSKLAPFDDSNLGDPQDFLKNVRTQLEHARDTIDDRISLMSDSEVRLLELSSPIWTIREPLETGLDSGTCPTIETVLERGHTTTIGTASHNLTSEKNIPYAARKRSGRDAIAQSVRNKSPVGPPQPRQFFLVRRSISRSHSAEYKQGDTRADEAQARGSENRSGETGNPVRSTSAPIIISFEEEATSIPPVFPLVTAEDSLAASQLPGIQSGAAAMDVPLVVERETSESPPLEEPLETVEDVPREETHAEDVLPESNSPEVAGEPELEQLSTIHPADGLQLPEPPMEEAAAASTTSNFELGPPIDLARDTDLVRERSNNSARDWDSSLSEATNDAEDCGTPVAEEYCDQKLPMIDTFARSRIDVMETFDDMAFEDDEEDRPEDDQTNDLPQASNYQEEQEYVTAPSTPGLSSGSDASPRYSILTTPIMMRTHALANDGTLAVSALDYAKEGPASQPEESAAQYDEDAPIDVHDIDVGDRGEPSSPVDHIQIDSEHAVLSDLPSDDAETYEDCQLELPAADIDTMDQPASEGESEDAEPDAMVDDRGAYDYHYDAEREVQEASMVELPSSPTLGAMVNTWMCPEDADVSSLDAATFDTGASAVEGRHLLDDADREVQEASMIELPSSPTLGAMVDPWMYPEGANAGSIDEPTFDTGASVVDGINFLGSEESEDEASGAATDANLISEIEILDAAEIQLPPSPGIQAAEVDVALNDTVSDGCAESLAVEHGDFEPGTDANLMSEIEIPDSAETQLPLSPDKHAAEVDMALDDIVSDRCLETSAVEHDDSEGAALPEPHSSPPTPSLEDTQITADDMDIGDMTEAASDIGVSPDKEEHTFKAEETEVDDETGVATDTSFISETSIPNPAEMQLPPSPESQADEADPGHEDSVSDAALEASTTEDEGVPSYTEASQTVDNESVALLEPLSSPPELSLEDILADTDAEAEEEEGVSSYTAAPQTVVDDSEGLPEPSISPHILSIENTLADTDDAEAEERDGAALNPGSSISEEAHHFGNEETQGDDIEEAVASLEPEVVELPPSPKDQADEADQGHEASVSYEALGASTNEDEGALSYTQALQTVDNESKAFLEPSLSPLGLSIEDALADREDMDGENVEGEDEEAGSFGIESCSQEQDPRFDSEETQVDIEEAVESLEPETMELPYSPEIQASEPEALPEPSSLPLERSILADTEDAEAEEEEGDSFDVEPCLQEQDHRFDGEERQVDDIAEATESLEPEVVELPLSSEIQASEFELQPEDMATNEHLGTPMADHEGDLSDVEESPDIAIPSDGTPLPEMSPSLEIRASEPDLQQEDIATNERLKTPMLDDEGDFSHIVESHDIAPPSNGPSLPEMPSSPPMPPLEPLEQTLVGAETVDVEEDDAAYDSEGNANHEVFNYNKEEQDEVEELNVAPTADLVSETAIPDPVSVQLPPSPEIVASETVLEGEDIAKSEDMATLGAEQESNDLEATASDAHNDHFKVAAYPELTGSEEEIPLIDLTAHGSVPETNFSPTTLNVDDQMVPELNSDELTTATGTHQGDDLQEEESVLPNLNTEAVEAYPGFHARSDSSDLPTLFAPAISDWLLLSDPISPDALESVEHPHPYDTETTTVPEESATEVEAVGVSTEQQEEEGLTQPTASISPYLTAEEIPDPFDYLTSEKDSASIDEQTEDSFHDPSEQTTVPPHTPRRLTFPIPTPFSIRTSAFSPTLSPSHPPSPVLSHYSFDSRSSFSSDRHNTSPNRDSVDTIAPLPADEPQPEKEYRPSTAGWLGFHEAKPSRRFSMPLQHVWDPAGSSDRGSSRPGTAASTATVRYSTYRRERKRPVLAGSPRPMTSGALETVKAEDKQDKKGVLPKFVMLFAGMGFASKVAGGDGQQRG